MERVSGRWVARGVQVPANPSPGVLMQHTRDELAELLRESQENLKKSRSTMYSTQWRRRGDPCGATLAVQQIPTVLPVPLGIRSRTFELQAAHLEIEAAARQSEKARRLRNIPPVLS